MGENTYSLQNSAHCEPSMPLEPQSPEAQIWAKHRRVDHGLGSNQALWAAFSGTPGVGVSITDTQGRLIFVNNTSLVLFSGSPDVDYHNKTIADFHSPEFVEERLQLISRVINENKPLRIKHILMGRPLESTIWPFRDHRPPFNRVIVVTRERGASVPLEIPSQIEEVQTSYIDLGPLNVLSKRELEVMILLGHGLSVPRAAAVLRRSAKTIERHKESISDKLSLKGQAEIVQVVTSMGLDLSDTKLQRINEMPPE